MVGSNEEWKELIFEDMVRRRIYILGRWFIYRKTDEWLKVGSREFSFRGKRVLKVSIVGFLEDGVVICYRILDLKLN